MSQQSEEVEGEDDFEDFWKFVETLFAGFYTIQDNTRDDYLRTVVKEGTDMKLLYPKHFYRLERELKRYVDVNAERMYATKPLGATVTMNSIKAMLTYAYLVFNFRTRSFPPNLWTFTQFMTHKGLRPEDVKNFAHVVKHFGYTNIIDWSIEEEKNDQKQKEEEKLAHLRRQLQEYDTHMKYLNQSIRANRELLQEYHNEYKTRAEELEALEDKRIDLSIDMATANACLNSVFSCPRHEQIPDALAIANMQNELGRVTRHKDRIQVVVHALAESIRRLQHEIDLQEKDKRRMFIDRSKMVDDMQVLLSREAVTETEQVKKQQRKRGRDNDAKEKKSKTRQKLVECSTDSIDYETMEPLNRSDADVITILPETKSGTVICYKRQQLLRILDSAHALFEWSHHAQRVTDEEGRVVGDLPGYPFLGRVYKLPLGNIFISSSARRLLADTSRDIFELSDPKSAIIGSDNHFYGAVWDRNETVYELV